MEEKLAVLRQHLLLKVAINQTEIDKFLGFTERRQYKKGDFFLRQGRVARHIAFLLSGVMSTYSLDAQGEKHVIQISIAGHWTSDLYSFLAKEPTTYNVEVMKDADVLLLTKENFDRACTEIPVFERFFRLLVQNAFIHLQRRIANIYSETAEERYLKLIKEKPEIANSVPQHYLASFLGIKPQSLSRIRSNLAKKRS